MDKVAIIFSILTHDYDFMLWSLGHHQFACWLLAYYSVISFQKNNVTEKELVRRFLPDYNGINSEYILFSIVALGFSSITTDACLSSKDR